MHLDQPEYPDQNLHWSDKNGRDFTKFLIKSRHYYHIFWMWDRHLFIYATNKQSLEITKYCVFLIWFISCTQILCTAKRFDKARLNNSSNNRSKHTEVVFLSLLLIFLCGCSHLGIQCDMKPEFHGSGFTLEPLRRIQE